MKILSVLEHDETELIIFGSGSDLYHFKTDCVKNVTVLHDDGLK